MFNGKAQSRDSFIHAFSKESTNDCLLSKLIFQTLAIKRDHNIFSKPFRDDDNNKNPCMQFFVHSYLSHWYSNNTMGSWCLYWGLHDCARKDCTVVRGLEGKHIFNISTNIMSRKIFLQIR